MLILGSLSGKEKWAGTLHKQWITPQIKMYFLTDGQHQFLTSTNERENLQTSIDLILNTTITLHSPNCINHYVSQDLFSSEYHNFLRKNIKIKNKKTRELFLHFINFIIWTFIDPVSVLLEPYNKYIYLNCIWWLDLITGFNFIFLNFQLPDLFFRHVWLRKKVGTP